MQEILAHMTNQYPVSIIALQVLPTILGLCAHAVVHNSACRHVGAERGVGGGRGFQSQKFADGNYGMHVCVQLPSPGSTMFLLSSPGNTMLMLSFPESDIFI